jgi:hypothetical protein
MSIRRTRGARAFHVLNPGQGGVQLGVLVDEMVRLLVALLELGIEDTDALVGHGIVNMPAIATVIGELRTVRGIEADVIHIVALFAEFHL